ncbi:MAG: hypothetical protein AAF532_13385 [Planctomycetota bacterium]
MSYPNHGPNIVLAVAAAVWGSILLLRPIRKGTVFLQRSWIWWLAVTALWFGLIDPPRLSAPVLAIFGFGLACWFIGNSIMSINACIRAFIGSRHSPKPVDELSDTTGLR